MWIKKAIVCTALAFASLFTATPVFALDAEKCGKPRSRFTNIGFAYSRLDQDGYPKIHSDIGVNLTKGTTYFLHKPIAGCLRFGIDAVWADINYLNYKITEHWELEDNKFDIHQLDLGMQVGLSATVNLFKRFQAQAYFRYNPCLDLMINDGEMQAGFGNMFVGSACVSYGIIGIGIESRFGFSKNKSFFNMNELMGGDGDDDDWSNPFGSGKKLKTTLSGLRAFIQFRF